MRLHLCKKTTIEDVNQVEKVFEFFETYAFEHNFSSDCHIFQDCINGSCFVRFYMTLDSVVMLDILFKGFFNEIRDLQNGISANDVSLLYTASIAIEDGKGDSCQIGKPSIFLNRYQLEALGL